MKKPITTFAYIFLLLIACNAQEQTPQLLKQPANWQFERFALPPEFAPNIPYKGAEELRFSPGMLMDSINSITQDEIKNYLLSYFKGLCSNTAKQKNL